jgi:hypothetical protein
MRQALMVLLLVTTAEAAQPRDRRLAPVEVIQEIGVPLRSQLPPGDEAVHIKRRMESPLVVMNRFKSELDELIELSRPEASGAIVVEVQEVVGVLVDGDSWMKSRTSGRIRELVKSPAGSGLVVNGSVVIEHDGGEGRIDGRHVIVGDGPFFRAGMTYLVVVEATDGVLMPGQGWHVRANGQLGGLVDDAYGAPQFSGMKLPQVLAQTAQALRR